MTAAIAQYYSMLNGRRVTDKKLKMTSPAEAGKLSTTRQAAGKYFLPAVPGTQRMDAAVTRLIKFTVKSAGFTGQAASGFPVASVPPLSAVSGQIPGGWL
jgi:hypothetical protein